MPETVNYRGYTIQAEAVFEATQRQWKPSGRVEKPQSGELHRWDAYGPDVPSFITAAAARDYMIETAKQWIDETYPEGEPGAG